MRVESVAVSTHVVESDTVPEPPKSPQPSLNGDFDWDSFDSNWYRDHNYRSLRDDDQQIIEIVRDYFSAAGVTHARGVDVGSGANLYPALAMLPFCRRLDLREVSASNVAWLKGQLDAFDGCWDAFWSIFQEEPEYAALSDPRATLAAITVVEQASVFDLPIAEWDLGTMFFVACSISTDLREFHRAVHCFTRSLKPDSPFATAFMEKSEGYFVGDIWFPAVAIEAQDVVDALAPVAYDVRVDRIHTGTPLRDGYGGMLLATGRVAG
jgi:NNMT/PNMT/TEMT family protein